MGTRGHWWGWTSWSPRYFCPALGTSPAPLPRLGRDLVPFLHCCSSMRRWAGPDTLPGACAPRGEAGLPSCSPLGCVSVSPGAVVWQLLAEVVWGFGKLPPPRALPASCAGWEVPAPHCWWGGVLCSKCITSPQKHTWKKQQEGSEAGKGGVRWPFSFLDKCFSPLLCCSVFPGHSQGAAPRRSCARSRGSAAASSADDIFSRRPALYPARLMVYWQICLLFIPSFYICRHC